MPTILEPLQPGDELAFVMSFLEHSAAEREAFEPVWQECFENYLVQPPSDDIDSSSKGYPLGIPTSERRLGYSVLKNPESHQIVETLLASVCLSLMAEPGFIVSRRVGVEDTFKASTVTRLLEYDLRLPSHFLTFYRWFKTGFICGTGIMENLWEYREGMSTERSISVMGGMEMSEYNQVPMVEYDDPMLRNILPTDFYPDPSADTIERMSGCVVRFKTSGRAARKMAETRGWDKAAVERAILSGASRDGREMSVRDVFEEPSRSRDRRRHPDYIPLYGYTFWGEVPWTPRQTKSDPVGDTWRKITVLGGEVVESISWPLQYRRLPFYEFTLAPMEGRFWGLSPLEVSRHSQDLADTLMMMIGDAAVKMVHPQPVVHRDSGVKAASFLNPSPNKPILTNMMDGVAYLKYGADVQQTSQVLGMTVNSMRERTGATDVNQGQPFGTKRLSGTEAAIVGQRSQSRPELLNMLAEREYLPPIGRGLLSLNQMFLADSNELTMRVGESPTPFPIAEIMGQHDLAFVGSRLEKNKEQRLGALERFAGVIGNLPVAPLAPWGGFLASYLRDLDLPELEAAVADPDSTMVYTMLGQIGRGQGGPAQNGVAEEQAPSGLLPAQAAGGLGA